MRKKFFTACILAFCLFTMLFYTWIKEQENNETPAAQPQPITITWFVAQQDYKKVWNPQGNVSDAKILERTGVNLEITSGGLQDLDAYIAMGTLPDLITVEADATERTLLENSKMAAPLEPLFERYAPQADIPASMKEWYRNADGNWYAIASYYYGPERVNREFGGYLGTHNNNYVRADLLDLTGMSMEQLQTKEGLLEALEAASRLTYQGKAVIPYSGWWTQNLAEQFGMQIEDENGNLLSMYRQPEWLEALQFGNLLYRKGLMTEEEFTESTSQRLQQIADGRIFFCTGYANIKQAKDALQSMDGKAKMQYAGHVHGDAGARPNLKSVASGGWTVTLVHKGAPHMEQIIKFIAYMASEEGTLDAAPEIGAGTYDIINGACIRKASVKQEFQEDYARASAKYFLNLEFFVDWTIVQKYQVKSERINFEKQYRSCHIYDSKASDAARTIDSESRMAQIKERIEAYYRMAEVRILTSSSAKACKAEYQETIETMEELGLRELEEFERQQYTQAKELLGTVIK